MLMTSHHARLLSATTVRSLLSDGEEIALLDIREEGVFNQGHTFHAVSAPFSHLEWRLSKLVPRLDTRIVLIDAGNEGLARRAADRMAGWGYTDLAILDGGMKAWSDAGFEVFAGVNVPSKAFGEFIEHRYGTPSIDAAQLKEWQLAGKPMVILDSRPYTEFHNYSLPGGINCPGAELVHRVFDLVDDEQTTIVVNCAGRTRGIIGAQSLINAGIPNPVVTVRNGTAGWYLAGETMARGARAVASPPSYRGQKRAIAASLRVAAHFGVREIDRDQLEEMRQNSGRHTLYLFDVRSPEEYEAGHLHGWRSAPGGQLVQSTDHYIGTRGARIVLADDNGVRARMTASWLIQLGWDVCVLKDALTVYGPELERGPEPEVVLGAEARSTCNEISVFDLKGLLDDDRAVVVDLASSLQYRAGHIPNAWFAVRSRLAESLTRMSLRETLVLTSDDGDFARVAASDAIAAVADVAAGTRVLVLAGGTRAWASAGLPLSTSMDRLADETDDVWYSPYDYADLRRSMTAYLDWEVGLVQQMEREGNLPFREFPVQ